MADRLSWLIYGAGAIGTYLGASLLLHGQKVVFLEKPTAASHISENGLRLNIHTQEHRLLHPIVFSSLPEALAHAPYDIVVFALKSFDTNSVLDLVHPYAADFPPVLCLQNGVENESAIASILGTDKVIAGTIISSARRRGPGDVVLERLRGMGVSSQHPLSSRLVAALSDAGLNAHLFSSPSVMKWSKMLTNLIANASSAILDMPPSDVLRSPDLYAVEIAQLREIIHVCRAQQIPIINLPRTPVRLLAWVVSRLPPSVSRPFLSRFMGTGRGDKMPSLHIDLHSGRGQSEVDYLNGAVVRFGDLYAVPTPVNRWLNTTLLNLTSGEIPLKTYAQNSDRFLADLNASVN